MKHRANKENIEEVVKGENWVHKIKKSTFQQD